MTKTRKQSASARRGLEQLESRLLLSAADLTVVIGAIPGTIPTGNLINVPLTVTNNNTAAAISTSVTLAVKLNSTTTLASLTTTLTLAAGAHLQLTIPSTIPANAPVGSEVLSVTTTGLTSNNATTSANIAWVFGTVTGFSKSVVLTAVDPSTGQTGVFSIKGPGTGTLTDPRGVWDMALANTTRASNVSATVSGTGSAMLAFEQISATSLVGAVNAPQANFVSAGTASLSTMTFSKGVLSVTMHDSSTLSATGHMVTVGAADRETDTLKLTFNNANDLRVNSAMPIASFNAASYAANVGSPQIYTTAYIGNVVITGNFTGVAGSVVPMFYAQGSNPATGLGIAKIRVGGNMDSSEFYADYGDIGPVTIGGYMDHGAEVYAEYGAIGNVTVGGKMDHNAEIYSDYGGIGNVRVGGNVDHSSKIEVGDNGDIGNVRILGNLDNSSEIYISDNGDIASVFVQGNVDNGALIETDELGNIGSVHIGGNLDHSAEIYADYGLTGPITITGNLDHGAEIYTDYGPIGSVRVGGNLDNNASIGADEGNVGDVRIGGNMDHSATIYSSDGSTGVGNVTVGGNLSNGAQVTATSGIKSVRVALDSLGTSGAKVLIHADGSIGAINIAGKSTYADIVAGRSITSLTVGGLMQNGLVYCKEGGRIGTISVGQLDATTINTRGANGSLTNSRNDFPTQNSSIGKIVIRGVTTSGVTHFITGNSTIASWVIGNLTCADTAATGETGLIEYGSGTVATLASAVTVHKVP